MNAFQLHRLWMLAFFGALASMAVLVMLMGQGNAGKHMLIPIAIFVVFWIVAVVSYIGLAISAYRLSKELGVWSHEVPLPIVYAAGLGSFYSVWLDRKAKQSNLEPGD